MNIQLNNYKFTMNYLNKKVIIYFDVNIMSYNAQQQEF